MRVFTYHDYKRYVTDRIQAMPRQGRGELQNLAKSLKIHPSLLSQILRGDRHLTPDQACELCLFLKLNSLETEYVLLLVEEARAGTPLARKTCAQRLKKVRLEAAEAQSHVVPTQVLAEEDRAVFYSTWIYTAVRNASAIAGLNSVDAIAERLQISRDKVQSAADFLISRGLCVENEGKIRPGPQSTHLPSSSPLVSRHHVNWRLQAMPVMENSNAESSLFFTTPMTLARKDIPWVREILLEAIGKVAARVKDSPSEELACLNLDWFKI